jgi:hypothetical protein
MSLSSGDPSAAGSIGSSSLGLIVEAGSPCSFYFRDFRVDFRAESTLGATMNSKEFERKWCDSDAAPTRARLQPSATMNNGKEARLEIRR